MISVIIPTLNEEKALPATLDWLLQQPGNYEVIVVDGGSHDRTFEIARAEPRVCLLTAPKMRSSPIPPVRPEAFISGSQATTGACALSLLDGSRQAA